MAWLTFDYQFRTDVCCPLMHDSHPHLLGLGAVWIKAETIVADTQPHERWLTMQTQSSLGGPCMLGYVVERLLGNAV